MNDMPFGLQVLAMICVFAIAAERFCPTVFSSYESWRVSRNRKTLRVAGLTPERYMATIDPTNYQTYAEAVFKFWPRRNRHEQRDAKLDLVGSALGPAGTKDIRDLKTAADRLNNRHN